MSVFDLYPSKLTRTSIDSPWLSPTCTGDIPERSCPYSCCVEAIFLGGKKRRESLRVVDQRAPLQAPPQIRTSDLGNYPRNLDEALKRHAGLAEGLKTLDPQLRVFFGPNLEIVDRLHACLAGGVKSAGYVQAVLVYRLSDDERPYVPYEVKWSDSANLTDAEINLVQKCGEEAVEATDFPFGTDSVEPGFGYSISFDFPREADLVYRWAQRLANNDPTLARSTRDTSKPAAP